MCQVHARRRRVGPSRHCACTSHTDVPVYRPTVTTSGLRGIAPKKRGSPRQPQFVAVDRRSIRWAEHCRRGRRLRGSGPTGSRSRGSARIGRRQVEDRPARVRSWQLKYDPPKATLRVSFSCRDVRPSARRCDPLATIHKMQHYNVPASTRAVSPHVAAPLVSLTSPGKGRATSTTDQEETPSSSQGRRAR